MGWNYGRTLCGVRRGNAERAEPAHERHRRHRIGWKPEAVYLCTCQMGRKAYPYLPNHKLNTLCDHLRLDLDHHNAGSDSRACALLLLDYLQKGLRPEPFLRTYRFADRKTLPYCTV